MTTKTQEQAARRSRNENATVFPGSHKEGQGAKTIKKNTNSTQNKSRTYRAKQYELTSFLSTDCELSTETCSKHVYSLGPRLRTRKTDSEGVDRFGQKARQSTLRWFGTRTMWAEMCWRYTRS